MRRVSAVFATVLIVGILAQARPLTASSQARLAVAGRRFGVRSIGIALDQVRCGDAPRASRSGWFEDGRVVYARGFGFATLSPHTPMTSRYRVLRWRTGDAVHRRGDSIACATGRKLRLDDSVSKYVPEIQARLERHHRSSCSRKRRACPRTRALPAEHVDPTRSIKLADILTAVDQLKPAAPPGTAYANNPLNISSPG